MINDLNRWKLLDVKRLADNKYKCTALVRYGNLICYGWNMTVKKKKKKSAVDVCTMLTVSFTVKQNDRGELNHWDISDYELNENPKRIRLDCVDDWYVCSVPDSVLCEVKEQIKKLKAA